MVSDGRETVLAELSRTRAAYEDAIDPSEKAELRIMLDELRHRAAQLADSGLRELSWEQLHDRVRDIRRRLDELANRRISTAMAAVPTEGGGGIDPTAVIESNRRVDEEGGRADLTRELAELLDEVERRRMT